MVVHAVNPLWDPRLPMADYQRRWRRVDTEEALQTQLAGLPWLASEQRRQVGRRLQRTLLGAGQTSEEGMEDVVEGEGEEEGVEGLVEGSEVKAPAPCVAAPQNVQLTFAEEAAHGLWELAVVRPHHTDFSPPMLRAVVAGLRCPLWEAAAGAYTRPLFCST